VGIGAEEIKTAISIRDGPAMLTFSNYLQMLDETNAQDASTQAQARGIAYPLLNKMHQLHMTILNDKSKSKALQELSTQLMGLAYLMSLVLGVQTGDRMLIQRGRGTI
jgi:hypothetical protein